jgi:protein-tyrosine kinase
MSKFFQALERAEHERALQRFHREVSPAESVSEVSTRRPVSSLAVVERSEKVSRPQAHTPVESTPELLTRIDQHLVSFLTPTSFEAEQYRTLRHMIEQFHRDTATLSVIAVSSPAVGDGKTTTAMNLAGALAQNRSTKVLLVDLDLRRPSVARNFGSREARHPGLVDAIMDPSLSLGEVLQPCAPFNLTILPAGRALTNPYETLKSQRLADLLQETRQNYDYIVIDTPPLIPFPDCRLISKWIDGFLVVVTAHKTPRKLVEEAVNALDPAKLIGLVFNRDDRPVFGYYYYYSDYSTNSRERTGWLRQIVKRLGPFRKPADSQATKENEVTTTRG